MSTATTTPTPSPSAPAPTTAVRPHRRIASVAAVVAVALATAVTVPLTASAAGGTVITEGETLTLRSTASTSGTALANIPGQTVLTISCQTDGPSITGPYGATTTWDKVSYGGRSGYVSDAWIYTGTNGRVAPDCGGDTPPPPPSDDGGRAAVVATAAGQLGVEERPGTKCSPYDVSGTWMSCVEWCALFATWAWNEGGLSIPREAFTGDLYHWAAANGRLIETGNNPSTVLANAQPGDMVLYGTGPATGYTSKHVDIVEKNLGDRLVVIGGNVGNGTGVSGVRRNEVVGGATSYYGLSEVYAIVSAG